MIPAGLYTQESLPTASEDTVVYLLSILHGIQNFLCQLAVSALQLLCQLFVLGAQLFDQCLFALELALCLQGLQSQYRIHFTGETCIKGHKCCIQQICFACSQLYCCVCRRRCFTRMFSKHCCRACRTEDERTTVHNGLVLSEKFKTSQKNLPCLIQTRVAKRT